MENLEIRAFNLNELDAIMEIWLNSNIDAHNFVDENYWKNNFETVKKIMPEANIDIAVLNNEIVGFIGIVDFYIAGIFIKKDYRKMGIGKELLDYSKNKYDKLSLSVYKKNEKAYNFYLKNEFTVLEENIDKENNEIEYYMIYNK